MTAFAKPGCPGFVVMGDAGLASDGDDDGRLAVTVDIREDMGAEVLVHFGVHAEPVVGQEVAEALEEEAVEAIAERSRRRGVPFVARLERATRTREGEPLEIAVTTENLHFFDPETGAAIYGA